MDTGFLQEIILDNRVSDILAAAGILLAGFALKRFVSNRFSGLLYSVVGRYAQGVDIRSLRELLRKPFGLFIMLMSVYLACLQLHYPPAWHLPAENEIGLRMLIWKGFQLSVFFSLTWILLRFIDFLGIVLMQRSKHTASRADEQLIPFIRESMKFVVISMSFFICLGAVFHVNVASLIAGLGIGGIAIALAAKDTLQNLLGSFTIFLDKPFTLGNMVKVGGIQGRVEKIGFRSTQLRTMEKTLISVPNKKMTDAELENISLRNMIRAAFPLTVRFDVPVSSIEKFKQAAGAFLNGDPEVARDPAPGIRLDRITENGVELSISFFILTTDIEFFSEKKENILLHLLGIAREEGVRFDTKNPDISSGR